MNHTIILPYGDSELCFELPDENLLTVAAPVDVISEATLETLLYHALQKPAAGSSLLEQLQPEMRLLLLVDDLTRPTPLARLLPLLIEALDIEQKGIDLKILIALGTHRPMTPTEIEARLGAEITGRFNVVNHEWQDETALIDLGSTENGTPIRINRLIRDADAIIGVGNITPHNLAGWSGGGKIVQPGICGEETTSRTHLIAARSPSSNLGHPINPVRLEIERVAKNAGLTGVVNTVLNRHGEVIHIVSGESFAAYLQGVELGRAIWEVAVPALADIVVVSSHPADIDFWQANKGLYAAERVIKRGGDIILVTPCPEGISSIAYHRETIQSLANIPSRQIYQAALQRGLDDYAALTVSVMCAACRELAWVTLVSDGLTGEMSNVLGFEKAESIELALKKSFTRQGSKAKITVLTHGGETSPVIR